MKRRKTQGNAGKRRTTLTLPLDTLEYAEKIARARKVNLSTVIAEALNEGFRIQKASERGDEVLKSYRRAFGGFSEQEMLLLDGIVLGPPEH